MKEFNISYKLRLQDPLSLYIDDSGTKIFKRVDAWIKDDPLRLWNVINSDNLRKAKLVCTAYNKLEEVVKLKYTDEYAKYLAKKRKAEAQKRVQEKLANGEFVKSKCKICASLV
ncbi:MAG: hypothetical protein JXR58_09925 [Bacteroidales bacterium]|nr:hypothetical protein [Bacteroidales bacterium]